MSASSRETIAAIATPSGRGGIGVVRISGSKVREIAQAIVGGIPRARYATYRDFKDSRGVVLDKGIALFFPAPRSYTGEDVLELHGHGGAVVLGTVLQACLDMGARLADPGEFTRRAFLEGKIDLAQAESVVELIDAASREAARAAARSLDGQLSGAVKMLGEKLTGLRALAEAGLDFPEEEAGGVRREDLAARLGGVVECLEDVLARGRAGRLLKAGLSLVLTGRPNVGKSTLLNRIVGRDRAIVTEFAGTTRDVLRESVEIRGMPVVVADTAGIREGGEEIEAIGIGRALEEIARADLVLVVVDATQGVTEADREVFRLLEEGQARIVVYNKADLVSEGEGGARVSSEGEANGVWVSGKSGAGMEGLIDRIWREVGWMSTGESVFSASERQLRAMGEARSRLRAAHERLHEAEIFAEELRLAQDALAAVTGKVVPDEILGEIFGRFCIGK